MSTTQQATDCPNPGCAAPAALGLCTRFTQGFGLQIDAGGSRSGRWDDVHCLVCGHFSTPYAQARHDGKDLLAGEAWLAAVDRALRQAKRGRLLGYLEAERLSMADLLSMRQAVQRLRALHDMAPRRPAFPEVALLRVGIRTAVPEMFGVAHGEGESEPFDRKVRVLGRLLGADAAEAQPRHVRRVAAQAGWFFYQGDAFIGLLALGPNRSYRGTLTIDGCLDRLLHAS